jgi:hypothetical protein
MSSPLYPLDQNSERSGGDPGVPVEDQDIHSDGANPGTECGKPVATDQEPTAIKDL